MITFRTQYDDKPVEMDGKRIQVVVNIQNLAVRRFGYMVVFSFDHCFH